MSFVALTVCYLFGTFLCTMLFWALWAQQQPPMTTVKQWLAYWPMHFPANLVSLIVAFVMGVLWLTGRLRDVATLFEGVLGNVGITLPKEQVVPVEFGTAVAAGFLFDLVARIMVPLVRKWLSKLPLFDEKKGG